MVAALVTETYMYQNILYVAVFVTIFYKAWNSQSVFDELTLSSARYQFIEK